VVAVTVVVPKSLSLTFVTDAKLHGEGRARQGGSRRGGGGGGGRGRGGKTGACGQDVGARDVEDKAVKVMGGKGGGVEGLHLLGGGPCV